MMRRRGLIIIIILLIVVFDNLARTMRKQSVCFFLSGSFIGSYIQLTGIAYIIL